MVGQTVEQKSVEDRIKRYTELVEFIKDEFKAGEIDQNVYNKLIMTTAYEYLSDLGDLDKALELLNGLSVEYFKDQLKIQMSEDSFFATAMAQFSFHLSKYGMVELVEFKPTQIGADA